MTRATDVYRLFATLFLSSTIANKVCQPTSVFLRCFAETKSTVCCLVLSQMSTEDWRDKKLAILF